MYEEIQYHLNVLIGKPLLNLGRASNLIWVNFGNWVSKKNRLGDETKVGEFSLHVQCSWRLISNSSKIIVAYRDVYMPCSQLNEEKEFNWEIQGTNFFDEKVKELNNNFNSTLIVKQILADDIGGVRVIFENGYLLELFPDESSGDDEYWRFITNTHPSRHMVVSGNSVEIIP